MASLYFTYSAMNAGKSTELLQVAHNYEEQHMHVALLSPKIDNRYGSGMISSRLGIAKPAKSFMPDDNLVVMVNRLRAEQPIDCILVDEAQFLTREQVWQLSDVVDCLGIPVMCYGLRTDAFGNTFDGSERLLALADKIVERKTICKCGRKATMVLRKDSHGDVVKSGTQIQIGDHDTYESVCRKHYKLAFFGSQN
jgi:thymidine kinase